MSNLYYVTKALQDSKLENYRRTVRRQEGSRGRAARARRKASEESWR